MLATRDHRADVEQYIEDVLSGARPACQWERMAVQRHVDDLARQGFAFEFDWDRGLKPIRFIELFPHVKGHWANQAGASRLIRLSPWQKFIVAVVFGWVDRETQLRRFTVVYLCVGRKNGKSTLAGGIALYMLVADNEYGAEVYCGATSEKQAWEVFRPALQMAAAQPRFRRYYGVECHAKKITAEKLSRMEPIIGSPGDGASPSCAIVDEYHEHTNDEVYDTMVGGMGARQEPLALVITTAGDNSAGPCYAMQEEIQAMLAAGGVDHPDTFGIIYTIDKTDKWTDPVSLVKANPNLGISVGEGYLKNQLRRATQSARKQNKFRTRHCNQWVSAREAWMNILEWEACADPTLCMSDFEGEACALGIDMSSTDDIAALVYIFKRLLAGQFHYFMFCDLYVTEAKVQDKDNEHYLEWVDSGELIQTDGNMIDYDEIEKSVTGDEDETDFQGTSELYVIEEIGYDPWGAEHLAQRLGRVMTDIEIIKVPPQPAHISEPMMQFESLVKDGRFHHQGNRCMSWMMSNVIAKEYDDGKRIRPVKASKAKKIDGPVAGIMALKVIISPDPEDLDAGLDAYLKNPVKL